MWKFRQSGLAPVALGAALALGLSPVAPASETQLAANPMFAGAPSLADSLPADTILYAAFDTQYMLDGSGRLDLVTLLDEPQVQEFLEPLMDQVPFLRAGAIRDLLADSPVHQFVQGPCELAIRGVHVQIQGEAYEISPSRPVTARLFNRLVGLGAQVAEADESGRPFQADVQVALDFVLALKGGPAMGDVFQQAVQESGASVSTVEVGGHRMQKLSIADDHEMPGVSFDVYVQRDGDRWVLGGNPATLKQCLSGRVGSPLSQAPSYRRFLSRVTSERPAFLVYANIANLARIVKPMAPPLLVEELDILGLSSIESLGLASSFVAGGVRDTLAITYSDKPGGLLSLLDCAGGGLNYLRHAPIETGLYVGARIDVEGFVDNLHRVIDEVFPGSGQAVLAGFAEAERELGMDVRENVLPALGTEVGVYLTAPGRGSFFPDGLLMFEIGDRDRFDRLMGHAHQGMEQEGLVLTQMKSMPEGWTGYSMRIPDAPVQPAFAVGDDYLAMGMSAVSLKKLLRQLGNGGPENRVSDSETFQKVMKGLTGSTSAEDLSFLTYVDLRSLVEVGYQFLPMAAGAMAAETDLPLDLSLMPEPDVIARHFSGMGIGGLSDEGGLSLSIFSPLGLASGLAGGAVAVQMEQEHRRHMMEERHRADIAHREAELRAAEAAAVETDTVPRGSRSKTLGNLFQNIERATGATIQYPERLASIQVVFSPTSADLEDMMQQLSTLAGFHYEIRDVGGDRLVVISS